MTPVPATSAHVPEDLVGVIVNEVGQLQIKKIILYAYLF